MLPGEDGHELEEQRNSLYTELAPANGLESLLVDEIAGLLWRLRRPARVEAALYAAGLDRPALRALQQAGEGDRAIGHAFAAQGCGWGRAGGVRSEPAGCRIAIVIAGGRR